LYNPAVTRLVIALALAALASGCRKSPVSAAEGTTLARRDLEAMRDAMLRYRADVGELPPRGDYCAACFVVSWGGEKFAPGKPGARPHMVPLEKALREPDGLGWKGPYLLGVIPLDPWGMEYTYDDNDPKSGDADPRPTYAWSAGPDREFQTDDDVRVLVLPFERAKARPK